MSIKSYKFKNGMKLVYQKNKNSLSAINIFVKVGSINEPKHLNGVSHFIEHMLFKGTTKLKTSDSISQIFDSIGAYINAATTLDNTFYTTKCDSDYTEICMKTLLDMIFNSTLDKKEIKKEKLVVIEEINITKDNPGHYINELIYSILFNNSSFAQPVGGEDYIIKKYKYKDIKEYYKYFYRPENIVVSVCSNISFSKIKKIIQKHTKKQFLKIKNTKFKPNHTLELSKNQIMLENLSLEKTYIAIGFRVCNRYNPDYYALDLLRIILTGNMSSLLFVELREKNGLTYNIHIDYDTYDTIGNFIILTNVAKNKLIKKNRKNGALNIIISILEKLKLKGITQKQLKIAKGYLKGVLSLSLEDTGTISQINGHRYLFDQEEKDIPLNKIYDKQYKNITVSQVNTVIKKYLIKKNMSSVYLGDNIKSLKNKIQRIENKL